MKRQVAVARLCNESGEESSFEGAMSIARFTLARLLAPVPTTNSHLQPCESQRTLQITICRVWNGENRLVSSSLSNNTAIPEHSMSCQFLFRVLLVGAIALQIGCQASPVPAPDRNIQKRTLTQEVRKIAEEFVKHHKPEWVGWTPLHTSSSNGNTDVVKQLIQNGEDVNRRSNGGWTPLHAASYSYGTAETAQALIRAGASVNAKNNDEETPLHWVSLMGTAEVLINAGADVNAKNKDGRTPLHMASLNGRTAVVRVLLRSKADQNIRDNNGKTPQDIALNDEMRGLFDCDCN